MTSRYLVVHEFYEDGNPEDHARFFDALKSRGGFQILGNAWLCLFNGTADAFEEFLRWSLDGEDQLVITEITSNHLLATSAPDADKWFAAPLPVAKQADTPKPTATTGLLTFEESSKRMIRTANEAREEITARFNAAVAAGDPSAYTPEFGIAGGPEEMGELGYHPRAPIKFLYRAKSALDFVRMYIPYYEGVTSSYEIGVGVGYLLRAMIDVHGINAKGCDVELPKLGVYREMRARLGLTDLVEEQAIHAGVPISIPPGTEAVTTFMSVFDHTWTAAEYHWFFDEMKRNGVSKVLWRPNRIDDVSKEVFKSLGGTFPVPADDNRFVIISL